VRYLFQAQPKGLVTLDFKQNGDYYISCAVSTSTHSFGGRGDELPPAHGLGVSLAQGTGHTGLQAERRLLH
jgi:hypothetical protein